MMKSGPKQQRWPQKEMNSQDAPGAEELTESSNQLQNQREKVQAASMHDYVATICPPLWLTDRDFAGTRQRKGDEPGTRGPKERRAARCRSPRAPDPRAAGGEARLGRPAALRRRRAARSAREGPTAPTPPGEGGTPFGRPGLRMPIQPQARPAAATPSARRGVPASRRRPARRPAAASGRLGKDEAQGRPVPRLPGARQRLQGGPRDARRPEGRAPRAAIAPTPAQTPAPAASPSRPPPSSQLLTSSPGGSALPPQGQISAAPSRRRGTQEPQPGTPSPPACPPLRASRSPLGILPREPPYYGATKLRSLPAPPLFSTSFFPSLAPSLPPISSSPWVASPAPIHLSIPAHRGVGTNSPPIRRRGPHLLTAPYRYPRPPQERERPAVKKKKRKKTE
ncbi:nascent polypeptide-associated complex subunit alpha, muscle-specific form-like [Hyaena hyaena]|uniref:nascent polypeptide-associated complex subunit alpha, muscle-specific form-like n=1 Tax=Hyaena hyaena TaxID=95912 RepID=UPI00192162E2|nr:nascent polypeptide-associated complex subunit alpha, muscle-specific form-like [Hyaena hyaena]